jgi:hypothetical protein
VRVPIDLLALEGADGGSLALASEPAREPATLALPDPLATPAPIALPLDAAAAAPGTEMLHQQVDELIDAQPDEVTATLRGWLADRRQ